MNKHAPEPYSTAAYDLTNRRWSLTDLTNTAGASYYTFLGAETCYTMNTSH